MPRWWWFRSSTDGSARRKAVSSSYIRDLGKVPTPREPPGAMNDILYVLVAVCVALLIVLIVDQLFMGAVLSEWLF